jgi:hypothetical protein
MVMQEDIPTTKDKGFQGGRYARTEGELYEKAIALLEKCKIEPGRSDQEVAELEPVGLRVLLTVPMHR